jgi:hypothetical protein
VVSRPANQTTVVAPPVPAGADEAGAVLAAALDAGAALAAALGAVLAAALGAVLAAVEGRADAPPPTGAADGATVAVGVPPQAASRASAPEAIAPLNKARRDNRDWGMRSSLTFTTPSPLLFPTVHRPDRRAEHPEPEPGSARLRREPTL